MRLSVATLVGSLLVSGLSFEKWQKDIDRFEPAIQKFEELDRTEVHREDAILFVGSSSIRLWETIAEDMAPYPVIQRGYGGAKFSDLAYFADRIISPHDYRALVIFVANDVSGRPTDKSPEETTAYFQHVLDTVRKHKPDVPVFLIEITPTESRWKVWEQIQETNTALKAAVEADPNGHFIQTAPHYLSDEGRPRSELFVQDRLHLNRDGYRLWASVIKERLDDVLDVPAER